MNTFKEKYLPYAMESERKTGISAIFILAQAALETGWGKYAPGNMFFGIKASATTPAEKRQLLRTQEVLSAVPQIEDFPEIISVADGEDSPEIIGGCKAATGQYYCQVRDWFRKYNSPEESFTDHARLLSQHPRYQKAMRYKNDPYRLAEEIAAAGYATDPKYAYKLKIIIDQLS